MTVDASLEQAAKQLQDAIQADWRQDVPFGGWLASEGERVKDNAQMLVEATQSGTLLKLLAGAAIREYLGLAWLEVHSKSYEQARLFETLAEQAT